MIGLTETLAHSGSVSLSEPSESGPARAGGARLGRPGGRTADQKRSEESEQKMNNSLCSSAGNSKAAPRPSRRDTSHDLHPEGKSLLVTPDSDYMDSILGCGPAGLRQLEAAARWGNLNAQALTRGLYRPGGAAVTVTTSTSRTPSYRLNCQ
jgi:hypothetical protein